MRRRSTLARPSFVLALLVALAPPALAYEQQVQQLSRDLAAQLGVQGAKKVAVVDFTDLRGEVNELGRFLAEELSVALNQTAQGFQVIDRTRLAVVFAEHKLGASGLIAPEDAKRLGQLVGADVLVSATMTPFGESVRLSVKALETETAVLVASARGDVPRTGAVDELLSNGLETRQNHGNGRPREPKSEPVSAKSFAFELQGCTLSGRTADCLILVENRAADRTLYLTDASRLFDELGNEYAPQHLRIANSERSVSSGLHSYGGHGVEKLTVQGVVTPVTVTFEEIAAGAAGISLLELALRSGGASFQVAFRDFPFSGAP